MSASLKAKEGENGIGQVGNEGILSKRHIDAARPRLGEGRNGIERIHVGMRIAADAIHDSGWRGPMQATCIHEITGDVRSVSLPTVLSSGHVKGKRLVLVS